MNKGLDIDPWSSTIYEDIQRLRSEFGIGELDLKELKELGEIPIVLRRGVIVGQRDFSKILKKIKTHRSFYVMSGLMPSGKMHLGHKLVIDQIKFYSRFTNLIHVGVADIEAYATRGVPFKKAFKVAVNEYLLNYLALGLNPDRFRIYFQSRSSLVKDLAFIMGRKVNLSTASAIYGFGGSTNLSHILSPLIQSGDILHPQLYHGPMPGVVPVGLDQDPHIRFTRDISQAFRLFNILDEGKRIGIYMKGNDLEIDGNPFNGMLKFLKGLYEVEEVNRPYKAIYLNSESIEDIDILDEKVALMERKYGGFGFISPSSTYHLFVKGLTGGKMSSSNPDSAIFLTDRSDEAESKIRRSFTGGRATAQEQRRLGGEPDKCPVFELYRFHLAEDDRHLLEVREECLEGKRLCGACKMEAEELMRRFLKNIQFERKRWEESSTYREMIDDLEKTGEHPNISGENKIV